MDGLWSFDTVTGVAVVTPDAVLERGRSSERVSVSPSSNRVHVTVSVTDPWR
ncbi:MULTISPECIES: hypothetical protein [unclassified Natrinema]|uniref:hypothetical protein n=1 Tax=unclassified Natrinema TaxID=2622230 RepID=UPI0012DE0998|nr:MULTISPECIES: hypothetical protein [unclassified Natrinema]